MSALLPLHSTAHVPGASLAGRAPVRTADDRVLSDSIPVRLPHGRGHLTPDYRFVRRAGLPNFASSIGMFVFISFSTIESRPSSHT